MSMKWRGGGCTGKEGRKEGRTAVCGRGRIIKNRENRRTVSRVAVRAPTKLDYFSQLLSYHPRALILSLSPFILSRPSLSFSAMSFPSCRLEPFSRESINRGCALPVVLSFFSRRCTRRLCIKRLFNEISSHNLFFTQN